MYTFYSPGKLLITAEYVVLDGAQALAVPTVFGQHLMVEAIDKPILVWKSINNDETVWFEDEFLLQELNLKNTFDNPKTDNALHQIKARLLQILKAAKQLNPDFLNGRTGFKVTTVLEFPKNWGLGTSSTLINNIAQWAEVDAYKLLDLTFGGSGYDIACAQHATALTYQIENNLPKVETILFNPSFSEHLYFVHLNKKQNSRDGIAHYKANKFDLVKTITEINLITSQFIDCDNLDAFQDLIEKHETLIAKITNQTPVKELVFKDFEGSIKSLGAWGGDFVLVASKANPSAYFKAKGFNTILKYEDMVLKG